VSRIEKLEKLSENTPGYTSTLTAYILLPGMFYGSEECFRFIGADTFFFGGDIDRTQRRLLRPPCREAPLRKDPADIDDVMKRFRTGIAPLEPVAETIFAGKVSWKNSCYSRR